MEPRYYDAEGRIDYDAIRANAARLRHEAIDAFWSALAAKVAMAFTRSGRRAAAQAGIRQLRT